MGPHPVENFDEEMVMKNGDEEWCFPIDHQRIRCFIGVYLMG